MKNDTCQDFSGALERTGMLTLASFTHVKVKSVCNGTGKQEGKLFSLLFFFCKADII